MSPEPTWFNRRNCQAPRQLQRRGHAATMRADPLLGVLLLAPGLELREAFLSIEQLAQLRAHLVPARAE